MPCICPRGRASRLNCRWMSICSSISFEHVKTSRRKEGIESVFASTEGTYNA